MIRLWRASAVSIAAILWVLPAGVASAEPPAGPAKSDAASCTRVDFRVVLDVGHTAKSPGAKSARGVDEFDFNLRLARQIYQALLEAGFAKTVLMVTEGRAITRSMPVRTAASRTPTTRAARPRRGTGASAASAGARPRRTARTASSRSSQARCPLPTAASRRRTWTCPCSRAACSTGW